MRLVLTLRLIRVNLAGRLVRQLLGWEEIQLATSPMWRLLVVQCRLSAGRARWLVVDLKLAQDGLSKAIPIM
jgi:hypothetical protein